MNFDFFNELECQYRFSFINTLPPNIDRESSGTGYHIDFGGFIYYIHPTWDSSWGGHLLFQNCDVDKIEPKPNRFVWINPKVPHIVGWRPTNKYFILNLIDVKQIYKSNKAT